MLSEETIKNIVQSVINQMSVEELNDIKKSIGKTYEDDETCYDDLDSDWINNILVKNPKDENALILFKNKTPARIGVGRAGERPMTESMIRFRIDHASAIDSVFSEVDEKILDDLNIVKLKTKVNDKDEYMTRPDLGNDLNEESIKILKEKCIKNPQIQIVITDGLSSRAIETNIKDVLQAFMQGLSVYDIKVGTPVFVRYGRVASMDAVGEELKAESVIMFIGERPGLATAESMSAYMAYNPKRGLDNALKTVVSNIHKGGTPPVEAGAHLATIMKSILDEKASGINLKK